MTAEAVAVQQNPSLAGLAPTQRLRMYIDLGTDERDLLGAWILSGSTVQPDEVARRIHWLIAERLERLASDASGWVTLYCDPRDRRFWQLDYPQSEQHGGGPPRLSLISPDIAHERFGHTDR